LPTPKKKRGKKRGGGREGKGKSSRKLSKSFKENHPRKELNMKDCDQGRKKGRHQAGEGGNLHLAVLLRVDEMEGQAEAEKKRAWLKKKKAEGRKEKKGPKHGNKKLKEFSTHKVANAKKRKAVQGYRMLGRRRQGLRGEGGW